VTPSVRSRPPREPLSRLSGTRASVGDLLRRPSAARPPVARPASRRPGLRRRGAALALALGTATLVAACGSGGPTAAAPVSRVRSSAGRDPAAAATACTPRIGRGLAAPGPFAVRRVHAALSRPVSGSSGTRRIDPTMWFPRAAAAGAAPGCRYDLILLSHGVSSSPDRYSGLAAHLASQGFVVLGPHHPDGASRRFDEGTERIDDLSYLLDHLDAVLQRLAPGLQGRVNGQAVGVAGHSFGAFTGAALAARDHRVKAALIMAGGSDPAMAAAIKVPTLAIAGGADPLVPIERVRGFADAIPATTPHGFAVIAGAGHTAYGDRCVNFGTCSIVARTASAMFLTYLAGVPGASGPLEPPHPAPRVTLTAVGMPPG